jgi:hypothetical protein
MKCRRLSLIAMLCGFCLLIVLGGCSDDDNGDGDVSQFAGTYRGTFTGDDSGSFTVVVDNVGDITGTGRSNAIGRFIIDGTVESNGDVEFGITTTAATFSGRIFASGVVSGTWENAGNRGTFRGTRQ